MEVVQLPDGPRADCPAERCVFKVALLLNFPAGRDKRPGTFEQAFTQSFIRKRTLFPQHPEAAVGLFLSQRRFSTKRVIHNGAY